MTLRTENKEAASEPENKIKSGQTVGVMVAGKYPLQGTIGYYFPEDKNVQVIIRSPRGAWSVLVPENWLIPTADDWELQIP